MEGEEALIRANATKERVLAIFFENTTFMKNTCQNLFYHEVHLPFVFIPLIIPLPKVYFLITDEANPYLYSLEGDAIFHWGVRMSWKAKLFVISVSLSVIGLFLPYPASLVITFASSISIFLVMGVLPFIVSTLIIGLIVLSPFLAKIAVGEIYLGEIYSGLLFRDLGRYSEERKSSHIPDIKMRIPKVSSIAADGIDLKVELMRKATDTILFGKIRVKSLNGYLRAYSSGSGKIVSGDLDSLEINGMGISVFGDGRARNLEVNGVDSSAKLSDLASLNLEVNGMGNSLELEIHGNVQAEINGMSNDIKLTFTKESSGEAFLNVNGVGNRVRVYIQRGSGIHVRSKTTLFNDVKIIKLR